MIQNTNKVEKYTCLHVSLDVPLGRAISELDDYVNLYISKGWQPWGPLVFYPLEVVFQPMVKYE
jgi:hypothetical protein